jgi:hypothetical protein
MMHPEADWAKWPIDDAHRLLSVVYPWASG